MLFRIRQWSQTEVTEHLNLISCVSIGILCFISRSGLCVTDVVSLCVDWVPTLSRSWFTVLWKVSLNLSNKPCTHWPVIRHCLRSPCGSLEVLKTSPLCLKERYESAVWCCGGGKLLCVRVDEIFDDFYGDMMSAVCAVCVRYQSLRWVWVTVDLIRLMGFCQSISVDFNKCVCEWVNKAQSHSQRLSQLWAREVRWVGARLRLVTQRGPPSSTVRLLHGTLEKLLG